MDDFFSDTQDTTASFLAREAALLGDDAALFQTNDQIQSSFQTDTSPTFQPTEQPSFQPSFLSSLQPDQPLFIPQIPIQETEPEPIRLWRLEFETRIAERDAKSLEKHTEMLAVAKKSLDGFFADYNLKKESSKRGGVKGIADDVKGTVWERVTKNVDLTINTAAAPTRDAKLREKLALKAPTKETKEKVVEQKRRDTSRMKALLINLAKDPKAPGLE